MHPDQLVVPAGPLRVRLVQVVADEGPFRVLPLDRTDRVASVQNTDVGQARYQQLAPLVLGRRVGPGPKGPVLEKERNGKRESSTKHIDLFALTCSRTLQRDGNSANRSMSSQESILALLRFSSFRFLQEKDTVYF